MGSATRRCTRKFNYITWPGSRRLVSWLAAIAICSLGFNRASNGSAAGLSARSESSVETLERSDLQAPDQVERRRPNFLVIVTDDQRADTFTAEFMPLTYTMIAENGVLFERGYVTTPLCCPSRSSILTGMLARHHGVQRNSDSLLQTTFVERLHEVGYYTGLVGKYLNSWDGSARPEFDYWVAHAGGAVGSYFNPRLNVHGEWITHQGYMTHILGSYALEFLQHTPDNQPFALLFTPNAPHSPFQPAPEHQELYPDLPPHRPPNFNEADVSDKPTWVRNRPLLTPAQIATIDTNRRRQLQMLKSLDDAIGDILSLLSDQGRLDETFVVFLSDNGFFWGEHRIQQGKDRVYEVSQRVPLAVRYPRLIRQPRVEGRIVANIDIAPTIYQLARVPIPPEVDGLSLVRLLRGRQWRDALLIESWPAPPYAAIETERFVYIENYRANGEVDAELYDLANDPYQLDNLANDPDYADIVEELRTRLTQTG